MRRRAHHRADYELRRRRLDAAFTGVSFWQPFTADAHAVGSPRLSDWLATTDAAVEPQFARRGLSTNRSADTPLSTSPMDAFVNPIRDAIGPRAYALKNRERTNRMLMLMQLHANRQDDERSYAKHIRQWLEVNRGRPSVPRRAISTPPARRRFADFRMHPEMREGRRDYHPILASRAETGEVLHLRLRKGSANTQRGILRFTDELIARVNRAGASGAKLMRADSGFWNAKVFAKLKKKGRLDVLDRHPDGQARPRCHRADRRDSVDDD